MELFKLLGTIAVENSQANQALDDTAGKADVASKQFNTAFGGIGRVAATVGRAVVGAGVALGTAWIAAIEGSREYRTEMGKLDTAFVTNGHSSEAAKNTYSELNSVLGDSAVAVEAANHLAVMTDNEKDLQTWTSICTGVFATFGDSLPIEGLTEAANETAKVGEVTGPLADALNWAGISEDAFNEKLAKCTNEQERQKLIMETLNGTYSKASKQYQTTNKDVIEANKAQERLTATFAEFGRVGEPILTAVKNAVADMAAVAIPKLESFIQKIKDAKKWLKDNKSTVDVWKAAIVGAIASVGTFLLILKWGSIMNAAKTAILGVRGAIVLLNLAMKANIIGLIVSLIVGLVAAFITLWKNNEQFRNFWINLWAKIKSACGTAVEWIKSKFNVLKGALTTVKNVFGNIKDTIAEKIESAKDKVKGAIDKIKKLFPLSIGKIFSNLKIPKISVSGGKAPFGIAGKGKLPSFDVKWNAQGGILTRPTIFGQLQDGTMLGGGEAGKEAIAPVDLLQDYVKNAVRSETAVIGEVVAEQIKTLIDFLKRSMPKEVVLDSGATVGALLPAIDDSLYDRWSHAGRGNVR